MNRRETTMGLLLLAGSALTVRAQEPAKVARIGVLGGDLARAPRAVAAFRQRLTELGYIEGRNAVVEYRSAEGRPERLPALAAELVALNVDVIVATGGATAAVPARRVTTTIPIVFIAVGDPVRLGLVESLARPGGNATGLSSVFPDAVAKLVELVHEALPRAKRIAILIDLNAPGGGGGALKNAEQAAQAFGMSAHAVEVRGAADFDRAFEDMAKTRTDALIVFGSPIILGARKELAVAAMKHRVPVVSALREYVDDGALMSYGPDLTDMFVAAANYVDRILRGAKPATLPVEQPTKLELVVNRVTAAALGITMPKSVLARAVE
jgi:putative ABC transport system substrate-binding protein